MPTTKSAPLYLQIYNDLKADIESGVYNKGQKIPSEAELSEQYDVSRITVRRAIEDLSADGYLVKMQGKGTFVGQPHFMRFLSQTKEAEGFSKMCEKAGMVPGAQLVDCSIVPARPYERELFGLADDALMILVRRVRTADGYGVCDENMVLPYDAARSLLTAQLNDTSLFDAITEATGHRPTSTANWTLTAVKATTEQASLLGVSVGEPLMRTYVTFYDEEGEPVCMGRHYFVGSRYELSF